MPAFPQSVRCSMRKTPSRSCAQHVLGGQLFDAQKVSACLRHWLGYLSHDCRSFQVPYASANGTYGPSGSGVGPCTVPSNAAGTNLRGWTHVSPQNDDGLAAALLRRPVKVCEKYASHPTHAPPCIPGLSSLPPQHATNEGIDSPYFDSPQSSLQRLEPALV